MATLVLGIVGRAVLGPVGGLVGTLLGGSVDRRLLGGGGRREFGRMANPEVQAASYGEPLPIVRGRMRISGNVVWAAPIRETATSSGGGKRGPATTSYSYSASFAVALCANPIIAVGRIWADGRLIRDGDGQWLMPATMRLMKGGERQPVDPLIAAAEGAAPAFRGMACAVFEDLPLAEFGNRLPSLSFEVLADAGPLSLGDGMVALAARAGVELSLTGSFPEVTGLFAGSAGPLAEVLGPALKASGAVLASGTALVGGGRAPLVLTDADADAHTPGATPGRERHRRSSAVSAPQSVELAYYDVDRDFQPGLQRARLAPGARVESEGLPLALAADDAKALARARLQRLAAGRQRRTLRLAWRHLGIAPGDVLSMEGDFWHVASVRFEAFVLALDLVRVAAAAPPPASSDPGRVLAQLDQPAGPTSLAIVDLPPLAGELPDRPRLWIAGAGASPGWRRADVQVSLDAGASYQLAGTLPAAVPMGVATTALAAVNPAGWDWHGAVEVTLLNTDMWLEGRSQAMLLAGANLALLGDEIVQFQTATSLSPGRFRLSGLLRGRRGTEWAVTGHAAGERFLLLDTAAMLPLSLPLECLGQQILLRPAGQGDAAAVAISVVVGPAAIQPLAPVHLSARRAGGVLAMAWIACSRAGFGWPDLTDVPSGESRTAFRVRLRNAGATLLETDVAEPAWTCPDPGGPLWLDVAQIGLTLGRWATLAII